MSINTVSANPGIDQLVQNLVSQADVNKDGQLSSTEFGSLLTHLLEGLSRKTTQRPRPPRRRPRSASAPTRATASIGSPIAASRRRIIRART